jgi:hypothetical protein
LLTYYVYSASPPINYFDISDVHAVKSAKRNYYSAPKILELHLAQIQIDVNGRNVTWSDTHGKTVSKRVVEDDRRTQFGIAMEKPT